MAAHSHWTTEKLLMNMKVHQIPQVMPFRLKGPCCVAFPHRECVVITRDFLFLQVLLPAPVCLQQKNGGHARTVSNATTGWTQVND